jgi:hypothetical protein
MIKTGQDLKEWVDEMYAMKKLQNILQELLYIGMKAPMIIFPKHYNMLTKNHL